METKDNMCLRLRQGIPHKLKAGTPLAEEHRLDTLERLVSGQEAQEFQSWKGKARHADQPQDQT